MLPAYENSLFSLDLERIVFVSVVKKGCDSVVFKVLHAICPPPPQVIQESLLEVLDSLIRRHTEKKRINDKDGTIMENVVKVLNPSNSATEQLSANAACTLFK